MSRSMIDPPIGELLDKVDCRYTLAVLASKRARQLIGSDKTQPLINVADNKDLKDAKPLSIAIEEIHMGRITYSRDEKAAPQEGEALEEITQVDEPADE